jgi:hypothetical protein
MRENAIHTARTKMNTQKLERNVFQIGFLVGHIATSLEKGILDNTNSAFLSGLLDVIRETEQRVADTESTVVFPSEAGHCPNSPSPSVHPRINWVSMRSSG